MTCCLPSSPESNPTAFDVIDFKLEEDLSRPFRLPLKLSSYDPINNFIGLLDTSALLTVLRDDEPVRYVQVQRDYTFTHPAYRQEHIGLPDHIKHQANEYERFDYPAVTNAMSSPRPLSTRATGWRHDARIAEVQGDDVRLQPALNFNLIEHAREDLNVHWRVISIHHEGTQFTSLQEEAASADVSTRYEQTAVLVPGQTEWRPAPLEKPRIDGPHMATVVGPKGEEIYCDEWGRVKVSFPWDRESQNNEFSSCWVRVSQGWAGGSWGSMAIPRIGQDVIIQYVNGEACHDAAVLFQPAKHALDDQAVCHRAQGLNVQRLRQRRQCQREDLHPGRDRQGQRPGALYVAAPRT